jgi:hypothetical protein
MIASSLCPPDNVDLQHWPEDVDADEAIQSVTFLDRWTYEAYYSLDKSSIYILRFDDMLDEAVTCVARYSDTCIKDPTLFLEFVRQHFIGFVYAEGTTKVALPEGE